MPNWLAALITLSISLIWLRIMDFAAHRGLIESRLSRKIIHITTGPVFVLCWFLFPETPEARWWAAAVPLLIALQFAFIGLGLLKDEASVQAMSRTGDRREILRGPLFYGIVFVTLTLVFWRDTPIGIIALMLMCGGDGIADVVGRRVPSPKLTWSREKSVMGSLSVLVGGFTLAAFVLWIYVAARVFPGPFSGYLVPLALLSLTAAAVESLPFRDVDNITVPLAVVLVGLLIW
ncbi:MAG: phosphatidate cytidylyltransferase [Anaerolineaceae bacterium]|nr:MAG: phosphatidate cytidylyltransferase [Anaerolineaceae bacterium]